jgi:4-amino-4-deoxy-L-arabinose transferase-like glycosyltransferase
MKHIHSITLAIILLFALAFRALWLDTIPFAFHNDEVSNTYVGKYILLNGTDIHGNAYPLLYFDKFGDFPPVFPMYLSGASALVFGNTVGGSRLLIALIGTASVYLMYLLSLQFFKRRETALFCAGLFASAPWHITLSRTHGEGVVGLAVFMAGLYLLLRALDNRKPILLATSLTLMLSTYLLYPSFRIVVPVFLIATIVLLGFRTRSKFLLGMLGTGVLVSLATTLVISGTDWGKGRFDQTSIFSESSGVRILQNQLNTTEANIYTAKIFNNKYYLFGRAFLNNYLSYFSPSFLFLDGDEPPRFDIVNTGLIPLSLLILFGVAAVGRFQKENRHLSRRHGLLWLALLLVAPVPGALTTQEIPNIHRTITMLPALVIAAGYGYHALRNITFRRIPVRWVLVLIVMVEIGLSAHFYIRHTNQIQGPHRNDGARQLAIYLQTVRSQYSQIIISNEERWFPIHYTFFTDTYDPALTGSFAAADFRIDSIQNLSFPDTSCPSIEAVLRSIDSGESNLPESTLIIEKPACTEVLTAALPDIDTYQIIYEITRTDTSTAFVAVTPRPVDYSAITPEQRGALQAYLDTLK